MRRAAASPGARRIPAILLACGAIAASAGETTVAWDRHYRHSLLDGALGGAAGLGFGLLATIHGNEETFAAATITGIMGGYLVGSAYGANTVSSWHEANGSFGLDLLGAIGAGAATILVGEGVATRSGAEFAEVVRGCYALAFWGALPAGAVVVQRLVAGTPPSLSAWHPQGSSPGTVGVVAQWSIR